MVSLCGKTAFMVYSVMLAILLAAFFKSDCDLLLNYLPFDNQKEQAFANKVVWVTGASSGIGAQLAKDFVVGGATVIISGKSEFWKRGVIETGYISLLVVSCALDSCVFLLSLSVMPLVVSCGVVH